MAAIEVTKKLLIYHTLYQNISPISSGGINHTRASATRSRGSTL